ncbi:MAG TPA: M23 family metallopeptidase [Acidobacteriaceae bacterium]|nr:M23 family metallopeptidase [Acidobacteriaceae bacterium]
MRKRYYIIFVSREDDGALRKIPIPLHYAYIFLAAAVVGLFTITGLAGSYSRMLLKTARFNQVRTESETLRKDYLHMERVAHEKDVQAASLGSLAGEVSVLYGLEQSRHGKVSSHGPVVAATAASDGLSDQQYHQSLDQLLSLRASALSGQVARRLDLAERFPLGLLDSDFLTVADAPSLWPVQGRVTSSFGERQDPFNGEGAFHSGIDIATDLGDVIRATANGIVIRAEMGNGYGREVVIDHGHGIETLYAHLSGFAVVAGQDVRRGDIIGYVGSSGRSTGPHLHYEVRIHETPVNPHKYLRDSMTQFASAVAPSGVPARIPGSAPSAPAMGSPSVRVAHPDPDSRGKLASHASLTTGGAY